MCLQLGEQLYLGINLDEMEEEIINSQVLKQMSLVVGKLLIVLSKF